MVRRVSCVQMRNSSPIVLLTAASLALLVSDKFYFNVDIPSNLVCYIKCQAFDCLLTLPDEVVNLAFQLYFSSSILLTGCDHLLFSGSVRLALTHGYWESFIFSNSLYGVF